MKTIYGTIVFIHVVSAVIAIGPLFLLVPIIKRLRSAESTSEEAFLNIIRVTIRIVMHAGHMLVVSGALLILIGPWPWHTPWVIATLVVLLLSGVFLSTGFTRVLRNYNKPGFNKESILSRLNRTSWIYIALMLIMLWLMVQKPILW